MRTTTQKVGLVAGVLFGCAIAAFVLIPTAAMIKHTIERENVIEKLHFENAVSRCVLAEIQQAKLNGEQFPWFGDVYQRIETACTERETEKLSFAYQANQLWQEFKASFFYLFK